MVIDSVGLNLSGPIVYVLPCSPSAVGAPTMIVRFPYATTYGGEGGGSSGGRGRGGSSGNGGGACGMCIGVPGG